MSSEVAVVPSSPDVAYVPGRLLVRGADAERRLEGFRGEGERRELPAGKDEGAVPWVLQEGVADPPAVSELLRAEGLQVQLDHVFFAHGCDPCAAAPHPSAGFAALQPAPWIAGAAQANPHRANPHRANPHRANDELMSSALPAADRVLPPCELTGPGRHPQVTVLDTGVAGDADGQRPPLLAAAGTAGRLTGALDEPDTVGPDGWLDPVAGHGTFIAGIVEQLAPGCTIGVERVIAPLGEARESDVYTAILAEATKPPGQRPDILSLSFGGRVLTDAQALRAAVARAIAAGIVVVASAGNDGSPLPQYPAAYPRVVAVGALGADGPAPWTNYGEWVDACAPGVDLVSTFFARFDGPSPRVNTLDPDHFAGWATWSGTSFSVPVVVAALAREMVLGDCDAMTAVERVVHAPRLLRLPCLGTVVNL